MGNCENMALVVIGDHAPLSLSGFAARYRAENARKRRRDSFTTFCTSATRLACSRSSCSCRRTSPSGGRFATGYSRATRPFAEL